MKSKIIINCILYLGNVNQGTILDDEKKINIIDCGKYVFGK